MESSGYKDIALDFLKLSSKGYSRIAFSKYVAIGFKHHNVFFKGDPDTLMIAMEENAKKYPLKTLDIKHILEDGNLVAIHSHVKLLPDHPGVALIHIFRFEVGKIMELWDFGQAVPEDGVNENGMF